jgi:septal ring factor EnvC (AmiA/AmiB activator)
MEADKQISDIATSLAAIKRSLESHTASFAELTTWKTGVESRVNFVDTKLSEVDIKVGGLNSSIDDLRQQIGRIELRHQAIDPTYKVFDVEHIDLTNSGAPPPI